MKKRIKPINDFVLVTCHDNDGMIQRQVGGIIIPSLIRNEKSYIGEIIQIGTDNDVKELFNIGDKVLYNRHSGLQISLQGKNFIMLSMSDILGIIIQQD